MLRLSLDPRGALEVAHEGPEVGARSALAERFGDELAPGRIGLAVFSSEGCQMCRALAPAVAAFGRDPRVVLRDFDEVRDADAWAVADVPGSPFAVALDADGTVLAKGTFNTGAQLSRCWRRRSDAAGWRVSERLSDRLAAGSSRRGFLSRVSGAVIGLTGRCDRQRAWSSPATPRRSTSAATSTRPIRARTRPACRGSTARASRCGRRTATRSTTSAA